jgi:signal transduction histidine kinase
MLKFFELNSIRSRMVSGFLFLTFLILVLSLVSLYIMEYTNNVAAVHSNISQLEIHTLSLIKTDNDFFDLEVTNEEYFNTGKSSFLRSRDSINSRIGIELSGLIKKSERKNYDIDKELRTIDSTLALYNQKFENLEKLIRKKGFKDFGLEGKMRSHAHALEAAFTGVDISEILYLRRHEKDFFLRHDTVYVGLFRKRYRQIIAKLEKNASANKEAIFHAQQYQRTFMDLAKIQVAIGLNSHQGLRSELNHLTSLLSNQYFSLSEYSYRLSSKAHDNGKVFYLITLFGAIFFSVLSGYWISKRLSEPIARLSKLVEDALTSKDDRRTDFTLRNAANEINTLTNSFILLMDQARLQMKDIQSKSKLLKQKNRELRSLNRELDNFLYSTAHDLRSPLTSLLGLINLMRIDTKHSHATVEYLNLMEKSIHRSEYFISQIVSYSKNKRMTVQAESINLASLIEEIFEHNRFIEGFDRVDRRITISNAVEFYSDRNRVTTLFNNLISNAIRYADLEKDHPFITISIDIQRDRALIEFSDNGIGIAAEHVNKIFDMFYRANHSAKGSGLGLFIFKETLTRLNGAVRVESTEGHGTSFFIRIPNSFPSPKLKGLALSDRRLADVSV